MNTDTAKYKPVCCYGCGKPFLAYTFSDTRNMRIDGKMYAVPVFAVPCMRCDDCNIAVTDGSADEAIEWAYAEGEIYHVGKESIQNIRKIRSNDTVHFQDNYWESLKSYCSMAIENFFPLSKDVIFDIKEKEKVIEVRDDREHYITIKVGVKENKTIASFIEVPCWCVFGIEGEAYGKSQSVIETVRTLVDAVQNRQKDLYFLDLLESEFADTLGSEQEIPEDFIF